MSDIIKAIHDDIEEYIFLCTRFNEKVQYEEDAYGHLLPNCYGEHCDNLKKRNREERKK